MLRLRVYGPPLTLQFAQCAQEFEVELHDENGQTGLEMVRRTDVFDQASHDLNVSMEWTAAVVIPRPGTAGNPPEPKNYTLHAWITTDGPPPKFAASCSCAGLRSRRAAQ